MADQDVRQRLLPRDKEEGESLKDDFDNLPLKAKLKLARKAKADPMYILVLEVNILLYINI